MKVMRAYLMKRSREGHEIYPDDQEDPLGNKIDGMLYDILKDVTLKILDMEFFMQEESIYGVFQFIQFQQYVEYCNWWRNFDLCMDVWKWLKQQ